MSTEQLPPSAIAPPRIPWQVTGNHWVALPCIHPADGSVYTVGVISQALRGSVEFAGAGAFVDGEGPPLLRLDIAVNGTPVDLGAGRMAWQRVFEWLPTFSSAVGDLVVRGTVFAPYGRGADFPGFVYAISLENRGSNAMTVSAGASGTLGSRRHRIRTAREFTDGHRSDTDGDVVTLSGKGANSPFALAIAGDGVTAATDEDATWSVARQIDIAVGAKLEFALYVAAAPERDGAVAMVQRMRQLGWQLLASHTQHALGALQQSTGVASVDGLVNRNLVFAYFYAVTRALDDARWYLVRSRAPWNGEALTIRDWDALMWIIPAVQLADPDLARELLLRTCELHGYAPGRGVNYLDGTPFDIGFTAAAVGAYAVAVERYIAQTGDDRIVEDPPIGEALYTSHDELVASRHPSFPLYRTDSAPSGNTAPLPYCLHANAVIADALDILRHTLDEKSAQKVESGEVVRAAIIRQFSTDDESPHGVLATAIDLAGTRSMADDPVGSAYWVPLYQMLSRDDSTYRRTVRRLAIADPESRLSVQCARLVGPDGAAVLEWLRRAQLDNGIAAELLHDASAVGNGGDAALSALLAYTVWYAVNVLGVTPG